MSARGSVAVLALLASSACAGVRPHPGTTLETLIEHDAARVMWVGAHPDDETLAGPILARACIALKRPCLMFVMNRGDGGECLRPEGCDEPLGEVRARELSLVARAYRAELHLHSYFNAPLPMSSFPPREEIARRWIEAGDPADELVRVIMRFRPTVIITFDPNHGFTGHPEHQLASRFATEAVRRAARLENGHVVPHVYHVLNRFWPMLALGGGDDATPNERFDTHVPCGPPGKTCLDVALAITKAHRTQAGDMGRARASRPLFGELYLRRIDPFDTEQAPPPLAH